MRSTINVKPYIKKEIQKNHPECFERFFDLFSDNEKYKSDILLLSVYDHILTEDEARKSFVKCHPDHPEYETVTYFV